MQPIIRPPSEANSFILLVMLGCPNNTCTFCPSYKNRKFGFRKVDEILKELEDNYAAEKRIFLADGDAVSIPQEDLIKILKHIKENYPDVERVSSYITPRTAIRKTVEELRELKQLGLKLVYLGVETGLNSLLKDIKKGATEKEMIGAGNNIKKSGMKLSVTIILGLGGKELSKDHAIATAKILNKIQPDYIGALTLMIAPGTEMYIKRQKGTFKELSDFEYLEELYMIIENLDEKDCIFRSNHASNYVNIGGTLPGDKYKMLKELKHVLDNKGSSRLRPEFLRGL